MRYGDKRFIYVMKCESYFKIGITNNVRKRLESLSCSIPFETTVVAVYSPKFKEKTKEDTWRNRRRYNKVEKYLHRYFANKRIRGEWFGLDQRDLEMIPALIKKSIQGHEITEQDIEAISIECKE